MNRFEKAMTNLQALRRKFESLLEAAREKAYSAPTASTPKSTRLRELTAFGANPGNLRMLVHVPEHLPSGAPLVLALHGCSQTADDYDHGTGWSSIADREGFVLVYPEQQPVNNPKNCFSWFLPGDIARDHGEARSIQQMIEHAIATFGVDRRKVFVTGLSAGGAMAAVMLATYPEVFAGGAIIAGLPYGSARSVQDALNAMFTEQSHSARRLGDRVRAASSHSGPWPKISIWHGTADPIVKPSNAENLIRQWTDLHGLPAAPSYEELIGGHTRRVWSDADDNALIEAYSINRMAHGVPLGSTIGEESCGEAGAFFLDAGICSTHNIARFWGLGEGLVETLRAPATVSEPSQTRTDRREVVVAGAAGGRGDADDASIDLNGEQDARRSLDPSAVIAAAFQAAGLPVPKISSRAAGAAGTEKQIDPSSIIQAALKAAGLRR